MPRIFDNINLDLLNALKQTLQISDRADFCVGYFNLRGWKALDSQIENWSGGEGKSCRLLVGMQRMPQDQFLDIINLSKSDIEIDQKTVLELKKKLAEEFRDQLTRGAPNNEDETGLRRLAAQIKADKVKVKLFLRHPLHAKLYLLFRPSDPNNPITGYLGSSNLTMAGLSNQGELNVDVLDHDACNKLSDWFGARWNDKWCLDISKDLVHIIEESWAREDLISPYYIYLKMAYHLSMEARAGLSEFKIPRSFGNKLFEFQTAAVKIAAHHLNKRGGVLIGDVVGLGKTLMATALARIFEDDYGYDTLILCPPNLVPMWEDYRIQYNLNAKILSISEVQNQLPQLRRFRIVLIDESHNLRNREGKRYRVIQEYIQKNDCKCILLSATPYNKTYLDLSGQLGLFVAEDKDLGIRPEKLLHEIGEIEFIKRHQCSTSTLPAFEKSIYADDWRELMRLYLVRRTRSFIENNYANTDPVTGQKYLTFEDGTRSSFPIRRPKTIEFKVNPKNKKDQYAYLFSPEVVAIINRLFLPRYGLGNYIAPSPHEPPTSIEGTHLQDLSRGGRRLMGFCRTNLFKRLESSGHSFLLSIERHILRNYIYLHAIENRLPLPIGTQDSSILDARINDEDELADLFSDNDQNQEGDPLGREEIQSLDRLKSMAADAYQKYSTTYKTRFKWIRSSLFVQTLQSDLTADIQELQQIIKKVGKWNSSEDDKLNALIELFSITHPKKKILVFSQFADTVRYLEAKIIQRGILSVAGATGDYADPTSLAWRFSPLSNQKEVSPEEELRILIATDVLSEGQNLQDCSIVVNFDLPWAIIRLIQRAGRVDRIGQKATEILCYSFLPAEGVERIIQLRRRVRERLNQNAEVVGTDESFFEDDRNDQKILDLYNEKSGILDDDVDSEVDLTSYAYQIWKNAISHNSDLEKIIPSLPNVLYSTKSYSPREKESGGVLVYIRTPDGNDALSWVNEVGEHITESQYAILKAAECKQGTQALQRLDNHHDLVQKAVEFIIAERKGGGKSQLGGQLGSRRGARFKTYERLKGYADRVKDTLFDRTELHRAIDEIYKFPLRSTAVDTLNRQLRSGISDDSLANLVIALREEDRLCQIHEDKETVDPKIICSMGLKIQQ